MGGVLVLHNPPHHHHPVPVIVRLSESGSQ